MQTSVLLSIKPTFATKIFDGTKRYEFRRAIFRSPTVTRVVVYASAPISRVIGEFRIERILTESPARLWEQTHQHAGIAKTYFDAYFHNRILGYALAIGITTPYMVPLHLAHDLNIHYAPQSFIYLDADLQHLHAQRALL